VREGRRETKYISDHNIIICIHDHMFNRTLPKRTLLVVWGARVCVRLNVGEGAQEQK